MLHVLYRLLDEFAAGLLVAVLPELVPAQGNSSAPA